MQRFLHAHARPCILRGLARLATPLIAVAAFAAPGLVDEFASRALDCDRWTVIKGQPRIADGCLILASSNGSATDIQSTETYGAGTLDIAIRSEHWRAQDRFTDSSFGLEIWEGRNGRCHSGIVMNGNGHLAVMRAKPEPTGICQGDPDFQVYKRLSDWDRLRLQKSLQLTIEWSPEAVRLRARADGIEGHAVVATRAFGPLQRFRLRLNVAPGDVFAVERIRYRPAAVSATQLDWAMLTAPPRPSIRQ
jgi:hypothetical protein